MRRRDAASYLWGVFICTALGAITGLIQALVELASHGYVSLGFWVATVTAIRDSSVLGALIGAGLGVILLVARVLADMTGGRTSWAAGRSESSLRPYLVCLALGLVALAARLWIHETIESRSVWLVLLVAAVWCGGFAVLSRISRRKTLETMAYLLLVLFFFVDSIPREPRLVLPWLLGCVALLLVVARLWVAWPLHGPGFRGRGLWLRFLTVLCVLAAVVPLALLGLVPQVKRTGPKPENAWNVVVIGIDTLRMDRTSLRDGAPSSRDLTPRLRELAARGAVFENAISQAPWTMPAFASILTGKYPHEHGAISFFGSLRKSEVTLAELLREHGYRTGAAVSHFFVDSGHGFGQGFEVFNEDNIRDSRAITSAGITDRGIELVSDLRTQPFFLFLHYFDPHHEYRNHAAWRFADGYRGWLQDRARDIQDLRLRQHLLGQPEIGYLNDLYDEEIAYTDEQIGRFLLHLKSSGLAESTVIVVVADHGEEFLEHGWLGHTISLHDEVIRVPMLVVLPGAEGAGRVIDPPVETRAIFSTVLDYLGIPFDPVGAPPSLMPMMRASPQTSGDDPDAAGTNTAYSAVWLPDAPPDSGKRVRTLGLRTERWKLIWEEDRQKLRLFDIHNDPGETTDVSSDNAEELRALFRRLETWSEELRRGSVTSPRGGPEQDLVEKLRSLGYL